MQREEWKHAFLEYDGGGAMLDDMEIADGIFYTRVGEEVVSSLEMSCRTGRRAADLLYLRAELCAGGWALSLIFEHQEDLCMMTSIWAVTFAHPKLRLAPDFPNTWIEESCCVSDDNCQRCFAVVCPGLSIARTGVDVLGYTPAPDKRSQCVPTLEARLKP